MKKLIARRRQYRPAAVSLDDRVTIILKVLNRIFSVIFYLIYVVFWFLTLIVLGFSLGTVIRFRQYEQNDLFDVVRDNVPLLLVSMVAVFALLLAVMVLSDWWTDRQKRHNKEQKRLPPFPWPMLLTAGGLSLFFVIVIHGRATNDALMLDQIMQEFAAGDYSALNPGGYLFIYPFQIAYVLIGEVIQAVCGPSDFMAYQILNVVSILVNLYLLYRITWELFESRAVCRTMQVLSVFCVFYYVYATFVYNDLWSYAFQTAALYLQILYMKRRTSGESSENGKERTAGESSNPGDKRDGRAEKAAAGRKAVWYEVGAGICIAIACLLKSNCYIALIAMVIMLIVDAVRRAAANRSTFHRAQLSVPQESAGATEAVSMKGSVAASRKWRLIAEPLLLSAMVILMVWGSTAAVHTAVAAAAGIDHFPDGVPAWNYVAMGMQKTEGKCGWYNGTNVRLYSDAGWDQAASVEAAKQSIGEAVAEFRSSGRNCVRFYVDKFLSQWGDPTCVSMREMEETERHIDNVWPLADSLIFGTGSRILQWIMNVIHSMIYLGTAVYAGCAIRRKITGVSGQTTGGAGQIITDASGQITEGSGRNRAAGTSEELLVLFLFGGMIFHELWEASGRYTMRYYLTMLPLAAEGLTALAVRCRAAVLKIGRKKRETETSGQTKEQTQTEE